VRDEERERLIHGRHFAFRKTCFGIIVLYLNLGKSISIFFLVVEKI
jgi:hypothetical protein